jgi:branched-chain amino acid transport system substrate-binding protein
MNATIGGLKTMARHRFTTFVVVLLTTIAICTARAEVRIGVAAPLTGGMAWFGEQGQRPVELAVAELNDAGGLLDQRIELIAADDYCDGEQAVAAANKLVAAGVVLVTGHPCSGAAIPASAAYHTAGVLMISNSATNPSLTDQGFHNVFRMVARDTAQAKMAAEYLAEHWADRKIAILHDGEAYGMGLAEETRAQLNTRGTKEVIFDRITPGQADYAETLTRLEAAGVAVLFYAGYAPEAGLLVRQSNDRGFDLQVIGPDSLQTEYFWHVAGPAAEGVVFPSYADPRSNPEAAEVVQKFRAEGFEPEGITLYSYAAIQAWAQAVERAGTFETRAVAQVLHEGKFDTVLGTIGFDEKGDVTGIETFAWYVWKGGNYVPLKPPGD